MAAQQHLVQLGSLPIAEISAKQVHSESDLQGNSLLVAAPGNGKTTALRNCYRRLLQNDLQPDQVAVITPTRASANSLRDLLAFDAPVASRWPKARSIHSFAHFVIGALDKGISNTPTPKLLSGAQQQSLVDDLLAKLTTLELNEIGITRKILELRGFRQEARDLLDVAQQHRVREGELAQLVNSQSAVGVRLLSLLLPRYRSRLESERLLDSAALLHSATDLISKSGSNTTGLDIECLLIDDFQDLPPAGLELVVALASSARIHAFADPDASVLGFRAASPNALQEQLQRWQAANSLPGRLLTITETQPRPPAILRALQSVSQQIPTSQVFRHRPRFESTETSLKTDDSLVGVTFDSTEAEARWLAAELRRLHFTEQIEWHEMALVARSRAELARFESEFSNLGVPSRILGQQLPLSSQQAAGAIIELVWHALGVAADQEQLVSLIRSPILGLNAISMARLSRQLRESHRLQTGELLSSFALLNEAISAPAVGRDLGTAEGDKISRLADVVFALRNSQVDSAHELVSKVWNLLGLADSWMNSAHRTGPIAAAANRNLDSVIHLFAAARRFDDRNPRGSAIEFIKSQRDLAIPEDAILPAVTDSRVALATPSSLFGRPKVVVLPALQQGLWPNLRQRGSMLGSAALDGYLRGRSPDSRATSGNELADERRMLYRCLGAATQRVIFSARDSLDETPSIFFSQLQAIAAEPATGSEVMSLRHRVASLRRKVIETSDPIAASQLRLLAEEGIPGAHPSNWQHQLELTTDSALPIQHQPTISASQLGHFEVCPLHWFINAFGGSSRSSEATLGTLIHKALESGSSSADQLWRIVESHWSEVSFDSEWLANRAKIRAKQMIVNLAQYLSNQSGQLLESERKVVGEVGGVTVIGRVDRLELMPDGTIQVVDIKTGNPPSERDASNSRQLQLYQLALAGEPEGRVPSGARIVALASDEVKVLAQAPLSHETIGELHALLEGFRDAIAQPGIAASVSSHCHSDPMGCGWLIGSTSV